MNKSSDLEDERIRPNIRFYPIRNDSNFEEDFESLLGHVCDAVKESHSPRILHDLVSRLADPAAGIIASVERYHVDGTYRSLYYSQYARRHFDVQRFTHRVSFFDRFEDDTIPFDEAYNLFTWSTTPTNVIQNAYLGSVVINPVAQSLICKAFLDPGRSMYWPSAKDKANSKTVRSGTHLRLSEYGVNIAGKKLSIMAFPYHAQDGEALSCAEVTLLNLNRYYSNEYAGYLVTEPNDILDAERRRAYSRVIPSTGLSYQTLCSILCDFGFKPELYDKTRLGRDGAGIRSAESRMQLLMHTYLESGIPVAVNVEPASDPNNGHSLVVMGHGELSTDLLSKARENATLLRERTVSDGDNPESVRMTDLPFSIRLLQSSDLYDSCIVMDDNQAPYSVRDYSKLSIHRQMCTARFIAPIQRGMTVDAMDAVDRFASILRDPADGVTNWAGDWLLTQFDKRAQAIEEPIVEIVSRIFLASTRRFKPFRTNTLDGDTQDDIARRSLYANTPLPHYVWVCELFLVDESKLALQAAMQEEMRTNPTKTLATPRAFAEIIIDATASRTTTPRESVLIKHFPHCFAYRMPDNPHGTMNLYDDFCSLLQYRGFPAYTENLTHVTSEHQQ